MKRFSAIIAILIAFVAGKITADYKSGKKYLSLEKKYQKNLAIIEMLKMWVQQKQNGRLTETFFERNNYHKIAIYGMNYLGERLLDDLQNSQIDVKYAIDRNADKIVSRLQVVLPDSELEEVDAIIVTAIGYFDEVKHVLSQRVRCPIVALDDVLGNL